MSIFRIVKYSSMLYFLGKYKARLFRVAAVLLFAFITSLLYQDVADYLQQQHPGTVIYALGAKIAIVYGALGFVLWQFRPIASEGKDKGVSEKATSPVDSPKPSEPGDALSALENVEDKDRLRSRYDKILEGKPRK